MKWSSGGSDKLNIGQQFQECLRTSTYGTGRVFVTYLFFWNRMTDVEENGHFGWVCVAFLFG